MVKMWIALSGQKNKLSTIMQMAVDKLTLYAQVDSFSYMELC